MKMQMLGACGEGWCGDMRLCDVKRKEKFR